MALAQPPWNAGWLAPIALVPWLCASRSARVWVRGFQGVLVGTLGGAAVASWIPGGLQVLGSTQGAAVAGWLAVALFAGGLPWGIFGLALGSLGRWMAPVGRCLGCASVAFGIDWLRLHASPGVPWALLGHSQWTVPGVAQLAAVAGVPAVSALLVAVNVALAQVLAHSTRARAARLAAAGVGAYGALALAGVEGASWARAGLDDAGAPVSLLIVQPVIPVGERWNPRVQRTNLVTLTTQTERALAAAEAPPDVVVWPETVLTQPLPKDAKTLEKELLASVATLGVPVLLGRASPSDASPPAADRYRNVVVWLEPASGLADTFTKTRAIPLVESARAFAGRGVLERLLALPAEGARVEEAERQAPLRGPSAEFAVALCYEAIFPGLVEARRTPATAAILNLTNDSWFDAPAVSEQQIAFASFRAIEQRLPLVRAAHGGASVAIDPYGRVVVSLPVETTGVLRAQVRPAPPPTVLERVVLLGLAAVGGALGWTTTWPWRRR